MVRKCFSRPLVVKLACQIVFGAENPGKVVRGGPGWEVGENLLRTPSRRGLRGLKLLSRRRLGLELCLSIQNHPSKQLIFWRSHPERFAF
jgi:hypothetical protein